MNSVHFLQNKGQVTEEVSMHLPKFNDKTIGAIKQVEKQEDQIRKKGADVSDLPYEDTELITEMKAIASKLNALMDDFKPAKKERARRQMAATRS